MTQPDDRAEFEAAYRRLFPVASSYDLQPHLFEIDEIGEYTLTKVFVAYALWRDARES